MLNLYEYHKNSSQLDNYSQYIEYLKLLNKSTSGYIMINWLPVEHIIKRSPREAYHYSLSYLRRRWPEAEPFIMKNTTYAFLYAKCVIRGRWPEAEHIMKQDVYYWEAYKKILSPTTC